MVFSAGPVMRHCHAKFVVGQYHQYFSMPHADQWIRTVPELGLKGAAIATTIGRGAE